MHLLCLISSCVFFLAGMWVFFAEDMRARDEFKPWKTTLTYLAMLEGLAFLLCAIIFNS